MTHANLSVQSSTEKKNVEKFEKMLKYIEEYWKIRKYGIILEFFEKYW
jgi:hypothetical protein